MMLHYNAERATPAERRVVFRAAMAITKAEMTAVSEEAKGRFYPSLATIDRAIDALRQVRAITATAHEIEEERQVAAAEQAAEVPL